MPTRTTITINETDANGKKVTNNITYVNPEITDANALILAQKISSLTTNTYESTERTDKKIVTITPRQFSTVTYVYANPNYSVAEIPNDGIINLTTAQLYNKKTIGFDFGNPAFDGTVPFIKNLVLTGGATDIRIAYSRYAGPAFNEPAASANLFTFRAYAIFPDPNTPLPFKAEFDFVIPATNTYSEWNKHIVFNVTEATTKFRSDEQIEEQSEDWKQAYQDFIRGNK